MSRTSTLKKGSSSPVSSVAGVLRTPNRTFLGVLNDLEAALEQLEFHGYREPALPPRGGAAPPTASTSPSQLVLQQGSVETTPAAETAAVEEASPRSPAPPAASASLVVSSAASGGDGPPPPPEELPSEGAEIPSALSREGDSSSPAKKTPVLKRVHTEFDDARLKDLEDMRRARDVLTRLKKRKRADDVISEDRQVKQRIYSICVRGERILAAFVGCWVPFEVV